jgi:hypothetical protein
VECELRALLESKGISTSGEIVVYGDAGIVSILRRELAEDTSVPVRAYAAGSLRNLDNDASLNEEGPPR